MWQLEWTGNKDRQGPDIGPNTSCAVGNFARHLGLPFFIASKLGMCAYYEHCSRGSSLAAVYDSLQYAYCCVSGQTLDGH